MGMKHWFPPYRSGTYKVIITEVVVPPGIDLFLLRNGLYDSNDVRDQGSILTCSKFCMLMSRFDPRHQNAKSRKITKNMLKNIDDCVLAVASTVLPPELSGPFGSIKFAFLASPSRRYAFAPLSRALGRVDAIAGTAFLPPDVNALCYCTILSSAL